MLSYCSDLQRMRLSHTQWNGYGSVLNNFLPVDFCGSPKSCRLHIMGTPTMSGARSNDKVCKIKFLLPLSIIFTGGLSFLITPTTTCLRLLLIRLINSFRVHSPPVQGSHPCVFFYKRLRQMFLLLLAS